MYRSTAENRRRLALLAAWGAAAVVWTGGAEVDRTGAAEVGSIPVLAQAHPPAARTPTEARVDPRYLGAVVLDGEAKEPSLQEVESYLQRVLAASERSYRGDGFWGPGLAKRGEIEYLQYNCRFISGLVAATEDGLGAPEIRQRIGEGLDLVVRLQGASGMIPHPNEARLGRGSHQPTIAAAIARGRVTAEGDWLVDAMGEAAARASIAQGNCARALARGYRLLGDPTLRDAAVEVADWVLARHRPHPNVNFNSFAVGALVTGHSLTGRADLLAYAVELTEEAVLPTQTESGRWLDAHNGLLNYHSIILHHLLELYAALSPEEGVVRERLEAASRAAVRYLADQVHGRSLYTKPSEFLADSIVALVAYDGLFGLVPYERDALEILVDSRPAASTVQRRAPRTMQAYGETAFGMAEYLLWRKREPAGPAGSAGSRP